VPRFCMWCTSGGTYQWEQKTNEAVSTSLGAMVLALPIPMIASPERTDGRTDDLLKKAAISLGTVRSQKTSLGQLKRPRESQQKNNWLPVRCCSSATCEMCLLRCGILLACVRACVRCCDEEEDTKGRVEECDPHYAASSYSPSHNVCLTGTCPGSSTLPGTWTSRPGNFFRLGYTAREPGLQDLEILWASYVLSGRFLRFVITLEKFPSVGIDWLVTKHLSARGMLDPKGGLHCFQCSNKTWTHPFDASETLTII
jgi:hypothetical protein